MVYDNICHYICAHFPESVIKWLATLVGVISNLELKGTVQSIKTELSSEPIRADFVALLETSKHIIQIEFQVEAPDTPMELRMLDYYVRLIRTYGKPVIQIIILLKDTKATRELPSKYESETTVHFFNIVRLWELTLEQFPDDPALLPFAVLAKCRNKRQHLEQIATKIEAIENSELKLEVSACTQVIAGLRFEKDFIKRVFKGEIMRQSVIYKEILEEGIAKGIAKGEKEGEIKLIKLQLLKRFGAFNTRLQKQLDQLTIPQIETLAQALFDFKSVKDLQNWLSSVH